LIGGEAEFFFLLNRSLGFLDTLKRLVGSDSVASEITDSYIAFRNSAGRSKKEILDTAFSSVTDSMATVELLSTRDARDETSSEGSLLLRRSLRSIVKTDQEDLMGCQVMSRVALLADLIYRPERGELERNWGPEHDL
jgi:hypothetical protein